MPRESWHGRWEAMSGASLEHRKIGGSRDESIGCRGGGGGRGQDGGYGSE